MADQTPSLDTLFLAALDIASPTERADFLDKACGADRELRTEVERLLESHEQAGSFLRQPAPELRAEVLQPMDGDARVQSLQAGLAAAFSEDQAVVLGNGNHSVLKLLGQTIDVPRIALRESAAAGVDPIVRPKSSEMPQGDADSRYRLDGEIARGGMGAILKGRDTDLGRELAIKVLLEEHKAKPDVIQRFIEEAQIGGQLQHPGIAPVYELGQFADKRPFFSMKLVKGETLAKLLSQRDDPGAERGKFLGTFQQVCQTMAYAHSRGVIHRDLKPANIMVGAFGEVQVMDWGLAKVLSAGGVADERKARDTHQGKSIIQTLRSSTGSDTPGSFGTLGSQTQMGSVMGTPAYMPPEQALGEIDHLDERADVFGLGAILCEILTGKPPYIGSDSTQVFRLASRGKLADCFQRLDACGADDDLIALTKQCLELEPNDRPRDAGVLAARVTEYLQSVENKLREAELAKVDAQVRAEELARRRKLLYAIASLLLLGLIGSGFAARHFYSLERKQRHLATTNELLARAREAERIAAVEARINADRESDLAREARLDAIDQTYLATLNEVRSMRLARQSGWRSAALERLQQLPLLGSRNLDRVELRTEALACLAELDVRPQSRINGPLRTVWRIEYSPDGRLVAFSDARTNQVIVHDPATDAPMATIPTEASFAPFAFHPSGTLAVASRVGSVAYHALRSEQPAFPEIKGHGAPLNLAFSRSGERVAVAWGDFHVTNKEFAGVFRQVSVHDTRTGEALWTTNTPAGTPGGYKVPLALSPDGETLAIAGPNVEVRLYSVGTSDEPIVLGKLDTRICAIDFHPDGHSVAVAGRLTGAVWELGSRTERYRIHAPEDGLWDIAYSPDGRLLAGALNGQTVRFWEAASGRELAVLPTETGVGLALAFAPHGDRMAAAGYSVATFQIEGRREHRTDTSATNGLDGLAFDAQRQAVLMLAGRQLFAWSLNQFTSDSIYAHRRQDNPSVIRLAPDGRQLAIGFGRWNTLMEYDFSVAVGRLDAPVEDRRLSGPQQPVLDLAFDPSGHRLAGASEDGGLYIWEFETGALEHRVELPAKVVRFLDANRILVGAGLRLAVVSAHDGTLVHEVSFLSSVSAFVVTRDGTHAIVGTTDGAVHRVRIEDLEIQTSRQILVRPDSVVMALAFDGSFLALAPTKEARPVLVDVESLETLARLPVKDTQTRFMEFDHEGRYLAIAGSHVSLWDLALVRGELIRFGLDFHELTTDQAGSLFADLIRRSPERAEKARIIATAAPLPGVLEKLSELAGDDSGFLVELRRYYSEQGESMRADAARARARALLEQQLRREPENEAAAVALVELTDDPSVIELAVKRHRRAVRVIGEQRLAAQDWEGAIAVYSALLNPDSVDVEAFEKRAAAFLASKQWDQAAADWRRIVELQPERLRQAFDTLRTAERWREAGDFGRQLVQQNPGQDSVQWMPIPAVFVLAGDREAYVDVCRRMCDHFAQSKNTWDAERTVKVCLLWPNAIDVSTLPVDKFTRALDDGTAAANLRPWFWAARALAACRGGDSAAAVQYVTNSEMHSPSVGNHALNLAIRALAQHELQRPEEARKAHEEGAEIVARLWRNPDFRRSHDLLIVAILLKEAASKIQP